MSVQLTLSACNRVCLVFDILRAVTTLIIRDKILAAHLFLSHISRAYI